MRQFLFLFSHFCLQEPFPYGTMRQCVEGGHIRQQTNDPGTQLSSNVRTPGTGQIVPVCLPLVSKNNQFVWVYSNQLELPADAVTELTKVFDEFPYLTQEQSVELAQRCSLLQDQVKVWFIAMRIQFGISWDNEDICDVRDKYRFKNKDDKEKREGQNKTDVETDKRKRKKKNPKDNEEESNEETGREEKNPKKGTTMAQEVSANANLERKTKQKQTAKNVKLRRTEDSTKTQKNPKLGSKIDEGRETWGKQDNDNEANRKGEMKMDKSENKGQAFTESEGAGLKRKKKKAIKNQMKTASKNPSEPDVQQSRGSFLKPPIQTVNSVPLTESQTDPQHRADAPSTPADVSFKGKPEALAGLQEDLHAEASASDIFVTDVGKLKEMTSTINLTPADNPPTPLKQVADEHVAHTSNRNKSHSQLAMLKLAFLHCQYPDCEQYTWLSELTKIPRTDLVQWYGDMRYALKRSRPRWMTEEQYKKTLGNIEYHQHVNKLKRSTHGADHMGLVRMLGEVCKGSKEEKKDASEVKFG